MAEPAPAADAPPAEGAAGEGGDGEIVGGPRNPQQIAAQKRLQQTQAQVDEVVDIMRTNVEKVLERDQKLSELDDRADALQQGASQFEQQAGKLKRKFWLQNLKMMIIMGVIGLVVVGIIAKAWVVPAVSAVDENVSAHSQPEYVHTDHNNNNAIGKHTKTSKSHKNNASEHSRTSSASENENENQSVNESKSEDHAAKHNRHEHVSHSEHAPEPVSETETAHDGAAEHTLQRTPTNEEEDGNPPAANA
ncbi:uncharacterized protein LOC105221107 isoform X2 [Zeugodacus cucurbitae]|uniref:uncharacterized protein LOC105221107 isoform X2 n=1 Tax=Zeugodacus cucurbitae TaxID=28588 RepID=UPI0005968CE9|nr:uncharacterized protein LOC105221107 isoform X2 [Zeugodacus cucurbitae]